MLARIWTDASFDEKWQIASFATLIILYKKNQECHRRIFTRVIPCIPTSTEAEYGATLFATDCIRMLRKVIGGPFGLISRVYIYNDCTCALRRFSEIKKVVLKHQLGVKTLSFAHCHRYHDNMKLVDGKARSNLRHFRRTTSWKSLPFSFTFQPRQE